MNILWPTPQGYHKYEQENKDKIHVRKKVKYPFMKGPYSYCCTIEQLSNMPHRKDYIFSSLVEVTGFYRGQVVFSH